MPRILQSRKDLRCEPAGKAIERALSDGAFTATADEDFIPKSPQTANKPRHPTARSLQNEFNLASRFGCALTLDRRNQKMHDMFPPFLACVTCTFNRFAPSWFIFVLLRFAAVAMIASPRMDVVRTLGILSVIEAPYYYLWKLSLYTWYSEDYNITPLERFGDYYTQVFQIGILQAIALLAICRHGNGRWRSGSCRPSRSDTPARWPHRTWPWQRVCRACAAFGPLDGDLC